jgi:2-amino-4-hydroxy-6-hydroxymethyldihydropteridine diphosphokinase
MARALIGLGSNLGDRRQMLDAAVAQLSSLAHCHLLARSCWHETAPIGGPAGQPPFLNGAATIKTTLSPLALLDELKGIEHGLKRQRHEVWGARTVDLDLLLYDELVLKTPTLVLPHPRMAFRRFVLAPAKEIAANWLHPTIGWTIAELLDHLDTARPYVAIGGVSIEARERLAAGIVACLSGRLIRGAELLSQSPRFSDLAGHNLLAAIELLDRQADLLASASFEGMVVSDFWFGQILAEAQQAFDPQDFGRFESHWRTRNSQLVQPKLMVWQCDPGDDAANGKTIQPLEYQLRKPTLHGCGPLLEVSSQAAVSPLEDALAAIRAMA